jgi:hypothetical protein
MRSVFTPIESAVRDLCYWAKDDKHLVEKAEYKRRDGFIPHSHNCGGLQVNLVVPKCEEYDFGFLEFGECDLYNDPDYADTCGPEGSGCNCDDEGHLSAKLAIWLKYEGIDDEGNLNFYLILHGGNNDAPYFRQSVDVFEASFSCKSVKGLKRAASKHVKAMLKVMGA